MGNTRLFEQITARQLRWFLACEAKAALVPELVAALEAVLQCEDKHTANCAIQPTWASGAPKQGPCDCCYGFGRAALARAKAVTG